MRNVLILLFLCTQMFAQDFIETTDGKRIDVIEGSIKMANGNKKIYYSTANAAINKIKVKNVASASYKDHLIKTFVIDKKRRAFYVLASANGKQLTANSSVRVASKGGFDHPYKRYEVAIIYNNSVIEHFIFTDVDNDKNRLLRKEAFASIKNRMSDCANLISRLNTFGSAESGGLTEFLDNPYLISCN